MTGECIIFLVQIIMVIDYNEEGEGGIFFFISEEKRSWKSFTKEMKTNILFSESQDSFQLMKVQLMYIQSLIIITNTERILRLVFYK